MTVLRTAARELLGLFVEDWAFALSIVAWVALLAVLGNHLPGLWEGIAFFAGLALATLLSAVSAVRRLRPRP